MALDDLITVPLARLNTLITTPRQTGRDSHRRFGRSDHDEKSEQEEEGEETRRVGEGDRLR